MDKYKEIIDLLKQDPNKLQKFEAMYQAIDPVPSFQESKPDQKPKSLIKLAHTIAQELAGCTTRYIYKNNKITYDQRLLSDDSQTITVEQLNKIDHALRPQACVSGMMYDMKPDSALPSIFMKLLKDIKDMDPEQNPEQFDLYYKMFRNGVDILDISPLSYQVLKNYPNNMSHWFPKLVKANQDQDFYKIPDTIIAQLPPSILQLTHIDYEKINQTTHDIINQYARLVFDLNDNKDYFIKTGVHSSKFDFRNAHVIPSEVKELGDYLLFTHGQDVLESGMNHYYGLATTAEWVVREYIQDTQNNPTIYHGLPLRPEYRVFIDCDSKQMLDIFLYWDPNTMKDRFTNYADSDTAQNRHDYITYSTQEAGLLKEFNKNKNLLIQETNRLIQDLDLTGEWSLDIMQNGQDFYLIDMATAQTSAFYDKIRR